MEMVTFRRFRPILLVFIALVAVITSCAPDRGKPAAAKLPDETERKIRDGIRTMFPGAVTFEQYTDSLLFFLYAVHRIKPETILLGQSTCVDDVLNTKSPFNEHMVKGPFNFGGLGGLPFTGLTGLSAYAHHVPDSGAALLLVGPHIGYSEESGWGMLHREGQHEVTTCCGALMAALNKLEKGILKVAEPREPDYQEQTLEQLALKHRGEILGSKVPLVTFTKLVNGEVQKIMNNLPRHEAHYRYVITIVGVIINTDFGYPDYIWVDKMSIYDLETEQYLKIMEK